MGDGPLVGRKWLDAKGLRSLAKGDGVSHALSIWHSTWHCLLLLQT
jgi:hypothetical protein